MCQHFQKHPIKKNGVSHSLVSQAETKDKSVKSQSTLKGPSHLNISFELRQPSLRPGSETTIYPGRNPRSFMVFKKFLPFTCRVGPAWSLSLNHYGNLMTSSGFRTSVKCLTKTFCSTRWYMLLCAQQMPHFQIKSLGTAEIPKSKQK